MIQIGIYVVLWSACLVWFWVGRRHDPTFAPAFAIIALYMILPITTFVLSIQIGKDKSWGKYRWLMIFFFGVMYSLEVFGTFSMANTVTFGNQHYPTIEDAVPTILISALGVGIGVLIKKHSDRKKLIVEQQHYNDDAMKSFDLEGSKGILEKYDSKECIVDIMEPLSELEDRKIQLILREINNTTLLYALAGASGKVCVKFMNNLSGRMLRFVDEQLEKEDFEIEKIKEAQISLLQTALMVKEKTVSC